MKIRSGNEIIKKKPEGFDQELADNLRLLENQGKRLKASAAKYRLLYRRMRESEEKFRKIVETTQEGIIIGTPDGRFEFVNQRFAEMLGTTVDELRGLQASEFIFAEDIEEILDRRRQLGGGRIQNGEMRLRRKDGGIIWTLFNAVPMFDLSRNHTGNLVIHMDITERKRSEEEQFRSTELFRTAFNEGGIPMVLTTGDGRFFKVNRAMSSLTGYPEEELTGMTFHELTHPEDIEINTDSFSRLLRSEIPSFSMEKRYIKKSGEVIWVNMSSSPVRDKEGNLDYVLTYVQDIDQRKRAETMLTESSEKYRELVQNAKSIILKQDNNGKITFFNEFAQELFGYTESEVLGKSPLETIVPENESTGRNMKKMLDEIFKNPDRFNINVSENRKKNGERIWIEWRNKTLFDSNGERAGHIAVGLDITERLKAEEQLTRSRENYRLLFEKMNEAFALHEILTDKTGKPYDYRFLDVNPSFEKQTGLKTEYLIGKRVKEVLPAIEDYWINEYGAVALTGKSREFENYSSELGRYYRVRAFSPQEGRFATLFEDITDRKNSEKNLRESREKLEIALESGRIGTWEWDPINRKLTIDKRMEGIFGIVPGQKDISFEDLIDEEDVPHFMKALNQAIEKDNSIETLVRTKPSSGNPRYISTKAILHRDERGNPVSISGACFDVTAMKKGAEKAIFKLNEELLRSNRELESFAYVASHDLQEPLRMVSSFTQLLEKRYSDKLDENGREYIKFVVDGAKRMYDLINGLLAYSRVQTKGKEFVPVSMTDVCEKAIRNLNLKISEKDARIILDQLPEVYADESQMIQMIQNLVENGIKFSEGNPLVHISSKQVDNHYEFSVRDEGIGIEPQYFERIFKIFQRVVPRDEYEGTGIGLAICKRIIERHSGRIWVESEPGKGSTFYFTIPGKA